MDHTSYYLRKYALICQKFTKHNSHRVHTISNNIPNISILLTDSMKIKSKYFFFF